MVADCTDALISRSTKAFFISALCRFFPLKFSLFCFTYKIKSIFFPSISCHVPCCVFNNVHNGRCQMNFKVKFVPKKKQSKKKMVLKKYELRVEISKIVKFRTISIIFNSTDNLMWWQQGIAFTRNMLAKETHTFISVNDLIFNSNASFFFFNKNKHIIRFSIVILINWCLRCASKRRKNLFFLFSNCCKSLNFCFQYFSFVVLICVLSIKKKMRIFGWRLYKAKKSLRYTSRLFLLLSFSKNQTKYQS